MLQLLIWVNPAEHAQLPTPRNATLTSRSATRVISQQIKDFEASTGKSSEHYVLTKQGITTSQELSVYLAMVPT